MEAQAVEEYQPAPVSMFDLYSRLDSGCTKAIVEKAEENVEEFEIQVGEKWLTVQGQTITVSGIWKLFHCSISRKDDYSIYYWLKDCEEHTRANRVRMEHGVPVKLYQGMHFMLVFDPLP